jgi:hypothetical protein
MLITAISSRYNLQHTHPPVPHYNSKNRTFTHRAAVTIDSDSDSVGCYFSTTSPKPVSSTSSIVL